MLSTAVGVAIDVQAASKLIIISPNPSKSDLTINIVIESAAGRTVESQLKFASEFRNCPGPLASCQSMGWKPGVRLAQAINRHSRAVDIPGSIRGEEQDDVGYRF